MCTNLSRDIQLRHMMRQHAYNLRHGRHFQGSPNNEYKIDEVPIMIHQSIVKGRWKILAEECDIRFHYSRSRNIVILIVRAIFVALALLSRTRRPIGASLPFETWFSLSYRSNTSVAASYPAVLQFFIYLFAFDPVFTFNAGCSGEGSVTLDQLLGQNPCMAL